MKTEVYLGGINRTLCDVLEAMRACDKTKNYASLLGLVEEAQLMANRMEAGLYDKEDVKNWTKTRSKLKKEIKALVKKIEGLEHKEERLEKDNEETKKEESSEDKR